MTKEMALVKELVRQTVGFASAKNTERAYRAQWKIWEKWARDHGTPARPANQTHLSLIHI